MIVIYPQDKTTEYLASIIDESKLKFISEMHREFSDESFQRILDLVKGSSNELSIIYLGHGTDEELKFSNTNPCHYHLGMEVFKGKKVFLLSCFSADYINNLNGTYEVALGFGNIIDSRTDLNYQGYMKYSYEDYKCIYKFSSEFVTIISSSLIEAHSKGSTYLQFFYALKLRINKRIAWCSLSRDKTTRLVGELLFDFKRNMVLKGNVGAFV